MARDPDEYDVLLLTFDCLVYIENVKVKVTEGACGEVLEGVKG